MSHKIAFINPSDDDIKRTIFCMEMTQIAPNKEKDIIQTKSKTIFVSNIRKTQARTIVLAFTKEIEEYLQAGHVEPIFQTNNMKLYRGLIDSQTNSYHNTKEFFYISSSHPDCMLSENLSHNEERKEISAIVNLLAANPSLEEIITLNI